MTVPEDCVRVEFPAETVNMAIARTVGAAMAARADLTVDQIEDVRLAMDEAISHLISVAAEGATVGCDVCNDGSTVSVTLECAVPTDEVSAPDPFAWTVLTALVGSVEMSVVDRVLRMQWSLARDHSLSA
ncbi:anti-sigma regulatory factor [bacterium]|jgi:serine/threonine-protein kinase RsbW|nr:anti-sigma regulatory factor [bacterium]